MRRFVFLCVTLLCCLGGRVTRAQQLEGPRLEKLPVPAAEARALATKLNIRYRDVPGVRISPDAREGQLMIMAPAGTQQKIAGDVRELLASSVTPSTNGAPVHTRLTNITWREFEDSLSKLAGGRVPVTTSHNGERASFQLTSTPLQGTTIEVDRRANAVTIIATGSTLVGWQKMMQSIDQKPRRASHVTELLRLQNAEPAPIQRALRLLENLGDAESTMVAPLPRGQVPFRRAMFQQDAGDNAPPPAEPIPADGANDAESGSGVIGDTDIQFVPELGVIIIRGAKRDVERVRKVIDEIEKQSVITQPAVEVVPLQNADSGAVAALLQQLYVDVLSARQGEVSITALDTPNSLLLIGRDEAIKGLMELIQKIDQPTDENSRLRVFRLQHASANDAEETIREFFTERPGSGDDLRPALGTRVRISADYRTNSLIISASPRDMIEVTRLINELDVQQIAASSEIRVFPLNNALAEDLAPVLQTAINGAGEGEQNQDASAPSTTLSIVTLDAEGNRLLDSGILTGAVFTADANANAVVVRAPAASMALIAELIRQLDKAPGLDSLVKVFTIENGDALQLTTALQELFGDSATTGGTSVGAGNLAGLAPSTASESSLVPLRFSTDQRTNSIIASGSAEDLEVVESILLRLDSEGFAERITEVIWLRHQGAPEIAVALQTYIQQRVQTVNTIQQFQQGLGPYDLPDRDLIVVAEPVSNSLLISVAPRLYEDVRRLIDKLDRRPPMVLIKVVIAEVTLNDLLEIGGELGLQDSLLYDRGVAAAPLATSFPPSTDPLTRPGFNFNGLNTPNANSFAQEKTAGRGVSALGVGTTSSAIPGAAGFVLSAASESISVLFRSLQNANRLQIISRPQIMTVDNTTGFVQVGQQVARPQSVNINQNTTSIGVEDVNVGLILEVTPRVGADGLIIMSVRATRSALNFTQPGQPIGVFQDGSPVTVQPIDTTEAQSTLTAYNNQTVVFGGLIQKTRSNTSRRVPYLADIPLLGYFFKFDSESEIRTELLVVMTPMIVTGEEDLDYVKATESSRMSYCLADVVEAHGDVGLQPGYGLWGPAIGPTIYPDLQPTVDHMHLHDAGMSSEGELPPGATIISDEPIGESIIESAPSVIESPLPQGSAKASNAGTSATPVNFESPVKWMTSGWRSKQRDASAPLPQKLPTATK